MLTQTSKSLDSFTHPRVSVAWQDRELVFRRVYSPIADLPVDVVGKKVEDFYDDKSHAHKMSGIKRQVIESGRPYQDVITVKLGGKKHIFDISIEPTHDGGSIDGLMTITIDVTDLMEAREQLNEANQRLVKLLGEALDDSPGSRRTMNSKL
jgi:hypothetical protein